MKKTNCHRNSKALARTCILLVFVCRFMVGCDYARMTDDEAVDSYETMMPKSPDHTVPVQGGIERLRIGDSKMLANPLPLNAESVQSGHFAYGYFCIHCHGPNAEGNGTVGQSFAPLPTNLKSDAVQRQSDGELFRKISLGYRRHPPLAATVAENDRWHIINYLRSISDRPEDRK